MGTSGSVATPRRSCCRRFGCRSTTWPTPGPESRRTHASPRRQPPSRAGAACSPTSESLRRTARERPRVRGLHLQEGASSKGLVHLVCVLGAASGGAALWVWSLSGGDGHVGMSGGPLLNVFYSPPK